MPSGRINAAKDRVIHGLTALRGDAAQSAWRRARAGTSSASAARARSRPWEIVAKRSDGAGLARQRPPPGPVTAADVTAFIETVCFVPEGKFIGQPLKLQDWQKDILQTIYDNPHGTRRAIISMGPQEPPSRRCRPVYCWRISAAQPARNKPNSELYSAAQKPRPGGHHLLAHGRR